MQKQRLPFMDAVRGLAAICVLTRHTHLLPFVFFRSYLAVDLFFMLSGFVIASAYSKKMERGELSTVGFLRVRLIRLYPMFFASAFLSGLEFAAIVLHKTGPADVSLKTVGISTALALAFVPYRLGASAALFPLNGAYWSLFFELASNLVYAVLRPVLNTGFLLFIIAASGVVVAFSGAANGDMNVGFSWGALSVAAGLARAVLGIFVGLLLHRFRRVIRTYAIGRVSPWIAVAVIVAVLTSPSFGARNASFDLFCIFAIFPVCVFWSARPVDVTRSHRGMLFLGAASYPLYVLHAPCGYFVAWAFKGFLPAQGLLIGGIFVVAMVVACALFERRIDEPLRLWITKHISPRFSRSPLREA
jgi:peptidoglycan/LPS O-acetylase OafA/YrhL